MYMHIYVQLTHPKLPVLQLCRLVNSESSDIHLAFDCANLDRVALAEHIFLVISRAHCN